MDCKTVTQSNAPGPVAQPRRRSLYTSFAISIAAIFLGSLGLSLWWSSRVQHACLERIRTEHLGTVGSLMVQSAEAMLAANELTALRRMTTEVARTHNLSRCRVVLPDGDVVADAAPSQITLRALPPTWPGTVKEINSGKVADGQIQRIFSVTVPGRGNAGLEIKAPLEVPGVSAWSTQAGVGAISVVGLLALLLLHRQIRFRTQGISAIRQALLMYLNGQSSCDALTVNPEWGPEAQAWNNLLHQRDQQRRQAAMEKTRESLDARQRSHSDLDAVCDALPQGLILVDENLRARYVNGAAAVLLQTRREDLLTDAITKFIPSQRVVEAIREATRGPMVHRTVVETEPNEGAGGDVLRFVLRPVRREDPGVGMIIIEDVTQQRIADKARNAFVAQATHEMRTPLTNIRLYLETALDEGDKDPKVRASSLNIINQEVRRLDRMIVDILSVAEIEAGAMKLKKDDVRLEELFHELQADYAAQAEDKGIELTFNLPPKLPVIQADRNKVSLGLHNLLGNAMKYTPSGGKVSVNVALEPTRLVVDVVDTGIGISSEDRQRIFEKFYRAQDRRVTEITGSGLGLAIAREVVRMHGGDISVESELNKGSTFTLVLPLAKEAA